MSSLPRVALLAFALSFSSNAAAAENRCGWYDNPTPGNAWLHDKEGSWELATQGGFEAAGPWTPNFMVDSERQYVITGSGSRGHGCVCMKVETDHKKKRILKVLSTKIKDLEACRSDEKLKEPPSGD